MDNNVVNTKNSKELKKAVIESFKDIFDKGLIKGVLWEKLDLPLK